MWLAVLLLLAICSTQTKHLNTIQFLLLFSTSCFSHSFDRHQLEKFKYIKENCAVEEALLLIAACVLVLFIAIISNQDFHVVSLETNNRNLYEEIMSFLA
jgi:hypothetical protein